MRCIIKYDKGFAPETVEQDLLSILHNKFQDILRIQHSIDEKNPTWDIIYDPTHNFHIILISANELEFLYPGDLWSFWAERVVESELIKKYNTKIDDDECPTNHLYIDEYQTFYEYLEHTMSHHSLQWRKALMSIELSSLPDELKQF